MVIKEKHIIGDLQGSVRLSDYLIGVFSSILSRKGIKKAILQKRVYVNGKIGNTGDYVIKGQVIELMEEESLVKKVFPLKLEIVFEDEFIAVINKPAGFPVSGNYYKTIQNAIPHNISPSALFDSLPVPMPVHRLDNQTRGLLLIAKTRLAQQSLYTQFENNTIVKHYHAVCIGNICESGTISFPIENKESTTHYSRVAQYESKKFGVLSVVKLNPETGRTHQIRIHLSQLGFPILGDKLYGNQETNLKDKGLFLAATSIAFCHPDTEKPVTIDLGVPGKFTNYLKRLVKIED